MSDTLKEGGADVGINFTGKADRFPFTIPSHALVEYAEQFDKHSHVQEHLYHVSMGPGVGVGSTPIPGHGREVP